MNRRRVTLSDVAKKADVHVTTVSLALRNHPRLPEITRRRIQQIAQQLAYTPDPFLSALVAYRHRGVPRQNSPTLAYITNWQTRWGWKKVPAHLQFFAGAESKAHELGYQLEHFWMHEDGFTQSRLGRILYARGINGLIIASHSREMGDELQLEWQHFSAVKIDYFPPQPLLHNVTNNQCNIIRLAMRKVRAAGYQRIGFVVHRGWDHAVDHNWTAGFLCEQQHLRVGNRVPAHIFPEHNPVDRWFYETNASVVADLKPFEKWFKRYQPEVIISKAAYVLPLLEQLGLKVPRDVAFVNLFLDRTDGSVAGVRQNHGMVGGVAVEILAGQLRQNKFGLPGVPTTTFVEGNWFDGATCPVLVPAPV